MTTTTAYFGGRPECGQSDDHVNVRRSHWGICGAHRTKWPIGANMFSSWHDETEDVWKRNSETLAGYADVDPIYAETSNCPRCNAQTIHFRSGSETMPHHPICRKPGTDEQSPLADETVRDVLAYLEAIGYHTKPVQKLDDEIPF